MRKTSLRMNSVDVVPGEVYGYWDSPSFWLRVCQGPVWVTRPGGIDEVYRPGQAFLVNTGVVIQALDRASRLVCDGVTKAAS